MMRIRQTAGRFLGREDGNFAVVAAFGMSMIVMAVGFGVNVVQSYQVKMSLRDAMDAAITSTARDLTTGIIAEAEARPSVLAFLNANGDTRFITEGSFTLDSLVIDKAAKTVEGTASATVDLLFPLFSVKAPKVSVTSAALYSDKKVEIAMMLDVTGSMGGQKIKDLRAAATNAVTIALAGQDKDNPRVRVALIPYAEAVNVGALADEAVFVERPGGIDLPPLINAPISVSAVAGDNCATERKMPDGTADLSDDGPWTERWDPKRKGDYFAKVNRDDRVSVCPTARIVPLTANTKKLTDTIKTFTANGVTAGGIAAQWGYYMLSPQWQPVVKNAGLGSGPAKFDPAKVSKVAILMTDGQFNTAFAGVSGTPQLQQGARSRSNAEGICARMRDAEIEVYTIGFDLDNPSMSWTERQQAKSVLKNCSSPDKGTTRHYFEASTGAELDAAFREIIGNTERLALIK